MALFSELFQEKLYNPGEIPKALEGFCLDQSDGRLLCPKYFNRLDIGNYLNHSKRANLRWEKNGGYFASRDIEEGEELLADYRQLGEPKETWNDYYKK